MAEVIKYETDRSGHVMKTPCPNGRQICGDEIFVGSHLCAMCQYFVHEDLKRHIVQCNYKECDDVC